MDKTDWKKELEKTLAQGRKLGLDFMLVDANPEKGYLYPYLVYIPKEPKGTIVIDCLNDYENELQGRRENPAGIEEVYKLFHEEERIVYGITNPMDTEVEDKEQTVERIFERTEKGLVALARLIKNFDFRAPAIVPLIPGYNSGEELNKVESQLDKDVIADIAPQIKVIIEEAKKIIKEKRPEIELKDKILLAGHSKSSTFANNFSAYYPEMCEAVILLGGEFSTLPIDEIALKVVEADKISDDEQFQIVDGKVTKKITSEDLEKIKKEYDSERREYQEEITENPSGIYHLPMNFPLGIADIEHYRDLSDYPGGKEGYQKALLSLPKMVGLGEQEETKPGHYAYADGVTLEGVEVKAGQDINPIQNRLGRDLFEIEKASMHNRVLESIDATRILLGRSVNERLRNFAQLTQLLDMPVQTKIYKGVGHTNFEYAKSGIKELTGISSRAIFESETLAKDMSYYYEKIDAGETPIVGNDDRAERVSPVPQLVRRFLVSKDFKEFKAKRSLLQDKTEEQIMKMIDNYLGKLPIDVNQDREFDRLTSEELYSIFSREKEQEKDNQSDTQNQEETKISRFFKESVAFAHENSTRQDINRTANSLQKIEQDQNLNQEQNKESI